MASVVKLNKYLKKKNHTNPLQTFSKVEGERMLPNSCYEASITLILKIYIKTSEKKENYRLLSLMTTMQEMLKTTSTLNSTYKKDYKTWQSGICSSNASWCNIKKN